jgi:hypothetical protein
VAEQLHSCQLGASIVVERLHSPGMNLISIHSLVLLLQACHGVTCMQQADAPFVLAGCSQAQTVHSPPGPPKPPGMFLICLLMSQ